MTDDDAIEVRKLRSQWYCLFMAWQVLHWIGIITISAGSAIVASKWAATPNARDGIALAVAITSAVYAVLEPAQRANSYRQAWVGMNLAYFKDKNLPATTFEAIKQGEEIIGRQAAPKGTH